MLRGISELKPYANLHLCGLDNIKGINEFKGVLRSKHVNPNDYVQQICNIPPTSNFEVLLILVILHKNAISQ